jgi:hypothetical protein
MLLSRRLITFFSKLKPDNALKRKSSILYDIPAHTLTNKFSYLINEDVPKDAIDFPLTNIFIKNKEDNAGFDNIPKLHHGLHKLLDGKIYEGDMGLSSIPQLSRETIAQMNEYKPPSQDSTLLRVAE